MRASLPMQQSVSKWCPALVPRQALKQKSGIRHDRHQIFGCNGNVLLGINKQLNTRQDALRCCSCRDGAQQDAEEDSNRSALRSDVEEAGEHQPLSLSLSLGVVRFCQGE